MMIEEGEFLPFYHFITSCFEKSMTTCLKSALEDA
jgi:hypothetical protein